MRITISLPERTYEQLRDRARDQRRAVRDQAAWIVERALRELGEPPRGEADDAGAAAR